MDILLDYFNLFQYSLQLRHTNLDMYFVISDDNNSSETVNKKSFINFLAQINSKATPFTICNVNYITQGSSPILENESLYNPWDSTIQKYLKLYLSEVDFFSTNFIATSPAGSSQLIIRSKDLVYFTKFFENWSILPIQHSTNRNHIEQYNIFCNIVTQLFGHPVNLNQMIAISLNCNLIDNYNQLNMPKSIQKIYNKYQKSGVLLQYNNIKYYINDWILFCTKLQLKSFPHDLDNSNVQEIIDNIVTVSNEYNECKFFHERFNTTSSQLTLFNTLPLTINKLELYSFI